MFVYKLKTEGIPIKTWMSEKDYHSDQGMVEQCENLAVLPFVYHHIALLSDGHSGYGMPIGGVMATKGVVVPNAVGVDIGCGVRAVKTDLKHLETEDLKIIMNEIRKKIPVGFSHNIELSEGFIFNNAPDTEVIQRELESSKKQIGTLGGGNHFIEIQRDTNGYIWIMIHSGSRNIGHKVATYFHKEAVKLCERWHSDIPDKELSFLPVDIKTAQDYFDSMNWCLDFASYNRLTMINKCKDIFKILFENIDYIDELDVHHNYATYENHFNHNVIVHRKGAISARKGQSGIIPGSQGTKSYIVRGKGNPESFTSCSHGAGRKMGRKQAIRELDYNEEIKKLSGVVHSIRDKNNLDEASGAYKDIDVVMEQQKDLVDIETELTPLGVIKG